MLESLCQGAGTLHELNLSGAFPARAPYRPQELYAALKQTPLFDAERGQWNWSLSEEQILRDTDRYSDAQLLGVVVEAQFDPERAGVLYEKLKMTQLYDHVREQWNLYLLADQTWGSNVRSGASQLLGVLAEAVLNPERARVLYEKLKATLLYDAERGQWNLWMGSEQKMGSSLGCYAYTQLCGVLVEAHFNAERAWAFYAKLKNTPLYDAARRQWNASMSPEHRLWRTSRAADVQLLRVLVEAQWNPEEARVLYEKLKATALYDPARRQWNGGLSAEQVVRHTNRKTGAQLLGVLVEAKLLSSLHRPLVEAVPPLPVTEDW